MTLHLNDLFTISICSYGPTLRADRNRLAEARQRWSQSACAALCSPPSFVVVRRDVNPGRALTNVTLGLRR